MKWIDFLATGFYSGRLPKAPGTWGTLVAVPLVIMLSFTGPYLYMGLTLALFVFSVWCVEMYQQQHKTQDAGEIVIDEIVGFLVTMTWIPKTLPWLVLGFLLFRVFDILKPFPIGWIDKKYKTATGVVADDVVAGLMANIVLHAAIIGLNSHG